MFKDTRFDLTELKLFYKENCMKYEIPVYIMTKWEIFM